MNHGSGTLVLQLNNNIGVADRRWHHLDVRSNSKVRQLLLLTHSSCLEKIQYSLTFSHALSDPKEVRFTLDRCSSAIIMETEGVDSWVMTEDRSSCEIRGVTPKRDK